MAAKVSFVSFSFLFFLLSSLSLSPFIHFNQVNSIAALRQRELVFRVLNFRTPLKFVLPSVSFVPLVTFLSFLFSNQSIQPNVSHFSLQFSLSLSLSLSLSPFLSVSRLQKKRAPISSSLNLSTERHSNSGLNGERERERERERETFFKYKY